MSHNFFLTLVRHGETLENRENVIQGQADTVLSDLGQRQASLVADRLKHERYTHMYSSDLSRAADTARAIASVNEVSSCELILDKRLRERSFGVMQGKKFNDLHAMLKKKNVSFMSYTPEGGECIEQVTKRALSFFNDMCSMVLKEEEQSRARQSSDASCETEPESHKSTNISNCCDSEETGDGYQNHCEMAGCSSSSQNHCCQVESLDKSTLSASQATEDRSDENNECDISILVVSHGLLLKELKCLILDKYRSKSKDNVASLSRRISPNTGVSKFAMSVSKERGKVRVICEECCILDCAAHLRTSTDNLVTEAKYDTISNA